MWSKDFNKKIILAALFASGSVFELSDILDEISPIANIIYLILLLYSIFNYKELNNSGYLWHLAFPLIGLFGLVDLVLSIIGKDAIIFRKIISGLSIIVWVISVNYLSNYHKREENDEI